MLPHNQPCGFYYQFVFYLTAVHQSEEDVGARNDDKHLSGFSSGAQKRQIAQKEDAGCCVSLRVTAADAHYWLRTIEKRRLHSGKGFRTQGLSEPLAVGCNKCTTRMTLPVILSVLLV